MRNYPTLNFQAFENCLPSCKAVAKNEFVEKIRDRVDEATRLKIIWSPLKYVLKDNAGKVLVRYADL